MDCQNKGSKDDLKFRLDNLASARKMLEDISKEKQGQIEQIIREEIIKPLKKLLPKEMEVGEFFYDPRDKLLAMQLSPKALFDQAMANSEIHNFILDLKTKYGFCLNLTPYSLFVEE